MRADAPVGDRKNMVFTGTTVTYGRGKAVVCATGMRTEFGKIAQEVAAVEPEKTPLERRTEEIGKWLGIITLGICALVLGVSFGRELMARHLHDDVHAADGDVRDRARRGRRSRGPGRDRDRRARDRDARDGQAQRAGAQDARRRDAGLHERHLLRQDRHPDQGRDDGAPASRRRPHARGERRRLSLRRQLDAAGRRSRRCGCCCRRACWRATR